MPNRSIAVHTAESNIERLDQHAEHLRRSRNSLINEAIEMLLEHYDAAKLRTFQPRSANGTKKERK
jgi:predicted transcriptional regulator